MTVLCDLYHILASWIKKYHSIRVRYSNFGGRGICFKTSKSLLYSLSSLFVWVIPSILYFRRCWPWKMNNFLHSQYCIPSNCWNFATVRWWWRQRGEGPAGVYKMGLHYSIGHSGTHFPVHSQIVHSPSKLYDRLSWGIIGSRSVHVYVAGWKARRCCVSDISWKSPRYCCSVTMNPLFREEPEHSSTEIMLRQGPQRNIGSGHCTCLSWSIYSMKCVRNWWNHC